MNKLIQELAKQAGLKMCGCGCDMPTRQSAKFAELVVKETIDEMITQMWNYGIDESNNPQFYKMIDRTVQEMLDVAPSKD